MIQSLRKALPKSTRISKTVYFSVNQNGQEFDVRFLWQTDILDKRCAPYFFNFRGHGENDLSSDLGYLVYVKDQAECGDLCSRLYNKIEQEGRRAEVEIFPNPATTRINIMINKSARCTLLDAQGKVLFRANISGENQIDISNWPNGIYFLNAITDDRQQIRHKFVIQH